MTDIYTTVAPFEAWSRATTPIHNGLTHDSAQYTVVVPKPEKPDPRIAEYTPLFDEAIRREDASRQKELVARQLIRSLG